MRLAFDIDGVLYDFHRSLYDELVALWGLDVDYDTFWTKTINEISKLESDNLMEMAPFYCNAVPDKAIIETVNTFAKRFGEVWYITARPESVRFATINSFRKWGFPNIDNIYFTDEKYRLAKELKLDIFVEDRSKYALKMKDVCKVYLVAKPWNVDVRDQFEVINSVTDLLNIL